MRLFLLIMGLSLNSCQSTRQNQETEAKGKGKVGQVVKNYVRTIGEALEVAVKNKSIKLPVSAAYVQSEARTFAEEMEEAYSKCYQAPKCPDSSSSRLRTNNMTNYWAMKNDIKMKETLGADYCYPNSTFTKSDGTILSGYWHSTHPKLGDIAVEKRNGSAPNFVKYVYSTDGGVQNAARHSLLFCFVAAINGYEKAKKFADSHEVKRPDSGLEDAWSDYWNNEIGLRFGTRLNKLMIQVSKTKSDYSREYIRKISDFGQDESATKKGKKSQRVAMSFKNLSPYVGLSLRKLAKPLISSCKSFLEGVIVQEARELRVSGLEKVQLMIHRPMVETRRDLIGFRPPVHFSKKDLVQQLPNPPSFSLPAKIAKGIKYILTEPSLPESQCIEKAKVKTRYWKDNGYIAEKDLVEYFRMIPRYR